MSKYILKHDEANCIACKACEIHCKTNKQLGPGPITCKIVTFGPMDIDGSPGCASSSCRVSTVRIPGV